MRRLPFNDFLTKDNAICARIPLQEANVGRRHDASDKPFLLGQNALEDRDHTPCLVLVPLDDVFGFAVAIFYEPNGLAVVRSLAGCLEIHPLPHILLVLEIGERKCV